jgi:hypothetical protein
MIELRSLSADDLSLVAGWPRERHVARWWLSDTTADAELEELRARVSAPAAHGTRMLAIVERATVGAPAGAPIGWCQWYPYEAYPVEAGAVGALPGDCGIDYAIVDPDVRNTASRRVLERNGFSLIAVRPVASEPDDNPMAIYRLAATTHVSAEAASKGIQSWASL